MEERQQKLFISSEAGVSGEHQPCTLAHALSLLKTHWFLNTLSLIPVHTYTYTHTQTHTYKHTLTFTHTLIHTNTHLHLHTHSHIPVHTYTHTHDLASNKLIRFKGKVTLCLELKWMGDSLIGRSR